MAKIKPGSRDAWERKKQSSQWKGDEGASTKAFPLMMVFFHFFFSSPGQSIFARADSLGLSTCSSAKLAPFCLNRQNSIPV